MKKTTPALLVLLSVACAQAGAATARTLFNDVGPSGVLFLRLAIAALVFAVVVRPRVRSWTAPAWRSTALLGVFSAGLNMLSYLALSIAPQGIGVTASFVGPLMLSLAQTRRPADLLWALMAATGVVLLGLRAGVDIPLPGLLLALAAGACGAGYIVYSARVGTVVPGLGGLAVSFAVGALMLLPFGAAGAGEALRRPELIPGLVTVAALSSVVPYALELIVLRHLPTRVFGVLMSLQPAAAAIAGLLILHQHLEPAPIAALVLVTVASIGVTRHSFREPLPRRDRLALRGRRSVRQAQRRPAPERPVELTHAREQVGSSIEAPKRVPRSSSTKRSHRGSRDHPGVRSTVRASQRK